MAKKLPPGVTASYRHWGLHNSGIGAQGSPCGKTGYPPLVSLYIGESLHGSWYFYRLVTQNMMRAYKGKLVFSEEKNRVVTAVDLKKRLRQIK